MDNINIHGTGLIPSGEYGSIVVCGSGFSSNSYTCNKMQINGIMNADNDIQCSGILEVNGKLTAKVIIAKEVFINGSIECDILRAQSIVMQLTGKSTIDEIQATDLIVKLKKTFASKDKHHLNTNIVACETADVESLQVETLKCNVLIGRAGTNINNLYYKDKYTLHNKAFVNNIHKI